MSVSTVGGASPLWQWQNQAAPTASTQAKGRAIANTDTASAAGNLGAFQQSLPADLQSLLGSGTSSTAAPTATAPADPTSQTASTKSSGAAHHSHHPHHHKGGSDPFTQSGSAFAADVTQAMQAYRSKTAPKPSASTLA